MFPSLVGSSIALLGAFVVADLGLRDTSLSRFQDGSPIRIGYSVEAPYGFVDATGKVTGEAPEIAKHILEKMGVKGIIWRQVEFHQLIGELRNGEIDVIAAGMFITPERAELVAFSSPTCHVLPALLVRTGNPAGLHSYQQVVASSAVRVAVLDESVEELLFQRLGVAESRLVRVPDIAVGRVAVESGDVDAFGLSAPTVRWMAGRGAAQTEIASPFDSPPDDLVKEFGFAAFEFRREDRALREAWNTVMADFIGSPEHTSLVAGFGFVPAELPGEATVAEILERR